MAWKTAIQSRVVLLSMVTEELAGGKVSIMCGSLYFVVSHNKYNDHDTVDVGLCHPISHQEMSLMLKRHSQ